MHTAPLKPRKRLGQHFLHDKNIIRKIVDAVRATPEDVVVEIGPGTGALTEELVRRFSRLTVIEVDERAVKLLRERFPDLDIRHQDILEVNWRALAAEKGGALYVVGNLPYYITSPILFRLFEARQVLKEAVLMMQLEVAQRLVALPGTKQYGILSVITQLVAEPELLFKVSPNVFYPKPDVWSAVVRLRFKNVLEVPLDKLKKVVRTAFNQRRKTLRNSLKPIVQETGRPVPESLAGKRAEALHPEEFVALTRYFYLEEAGEKQMQNLL